MRILEGAGHNFITLRLIRENNLAVRLGRCPGQLSLSCFALRHGYVSRMFASLHVECSIAHLQLLELARCLQQQCTAANKRSVSAPHIFLKNAWMKS